MKKIYILKKLGFYYGIKLLEICLQKVIDYIKKLSHSTCYANSMPAPVAQQVISSMRIIGGFDGTLEGKL